MNETDREWGDCPECNMQLRLLPDGRFPRHESRWGRAERCKGSHADAYAEAGWDEFLAPPPITDERPISGNRPQGREFQCCAYPSKLCECWDYTDHMLPPSRETDRPHRALEEFDALWLESHAAKLPGPSLETTMLRNIATRVRAALAPEQRGDAEPEHFYDRPDIYRIVAEALNRIPYIDPHDDEDWLVDVVIRALKRGPSSLAALAAPPQEGKRRLDPTLDCLCTTVRNRYSPESDGHSRRVHNSRCPVHGAAPTPDRKALHPDAWLREYERRKLALIEAATISGQGGSSPAQDTAERALDEWVLAALPGGREREEEIRASVYEDAALIAEECATGKRAAKELRTAAEGARALAAAPQASADTGER
jgi:hypothetical protein